MLRVTLNPGRSSILNCNQDPACVGTIVRTGSMDNALHISFDYTVVPALM